MAYEIKDASKNIRKIYSWPVENPKERRLAYKINKQKEEVTLYLPKGSFIKRIYARGFKSLPDEFSPHGHIKQGLIYYFDKMLSDKNVSGLVISRLGD